MLRLLPISGSRCSGNGRVQFCTYINTTNYTLFHVSRNIQCITSSINNRCGSKARLATSPPMEWCSVVMTETHPSHISERAICKRNQSNMRSASVFSAVAALSITSVVTGAGSMWHRLFWSLAVPEIQLAEHSAAQTVERLHPSIEAQMQ